jgi:hypothetical protein
LCVFRHRVTNVSTSRSNLNCGAFKILFDSAMETAATKSPYITNKLDAGYLVKEF